LAEGRVAFDGTAAEVTDQVLTDIYGEEDWSTTIKRGDDNDADDDDDNDETFSSKTNRESSAA